jgi:RNA polymerase sigma factor (sigma-70 family)
MDGGNATMLTNDEELQKAFRLIIWLQPDRAVALCLLFDACEHISTVRKLQERRPNSTRPFKLKISEESLLQLCIYWASDIWEKDQESQRPRKEPRYRPIYDDLLIRYVKTLAWKSMDRHSRYAAVGLGCLLYTYQPHEVSSLAEELFDSDNIRRVKSWMFEQIKKRFQGVEGLTNGNEQVALEVPGSRQRELIQLSLSRFAPWCSCPTMTTQTLATSLLETYFDKDSEKSEWERVHALFDPACGGLARLIREYNSTFERGNAMRLDDPEDKLGSPKFGDGLDTPTGNGGDGGPPDPSERFNPSPLTREEISSIRHASERNQRRRRNYKSGQLRVYVDGEETATFTRDYPLESFTIPQTASCIEVFGEDDEGELLLAVFPLNYLEPGDNTLDQKLYVIHDGGQTIELSISPVSGQSRESLESILRLEYTESFDKADTGTVSSSHEASSVFTDRTDSRIGIKPGINDDPTSREERLVEEQAAYSTGPVVVDSDSSAPHRAFWEKACEQFHQRLFSYARILTKDRVYDAEDLVQETVCRAFLYCKNPEEVRNPFNYLRTIMRRVCVGKWASQQATVTDSLDELLNTDMHPTAEPEVLHMLENKELNDEMRAKQGFLTPHEKLLLTLYLEGYKTEEIAAALREDVRIVRSDLNAVRAKVRHRLKTAKKRTSP